MKPQPTNFNIITQVVKKTSNTNPTNLTSIWNGIKQFCATNILAFIKKEQVSKTISLNNFEEVIDTLKEENFRLMLLTQMLQE